MRRAMKGEELTLGFFGGSITQGCLSSTEGTFYAVLVYKWWCDNFPHAVFHYVNGGIGGTSSHFGVARAREDLLMYRPDVVVIDFSVNDEPEVFFQETYEGLLRKLLCTETSPALLILNNVYYDTGVNAQEYHNQLADYYKLPYASMKDSIYRKIQEGEYTREEITEDGLHPNDKGHALVAGELIKVLEEAKRMAESDASVESHGDCPNPLTENAYENACRLTIQNSNPSLQGFRVDTSEKKGHLDCFKNGWIGKKKGDRIVFEVEGSCIAVQYRKTIHKPTPVARVIIDGDESSAAILDGNFEETWGDCLYLQKIMHHGNAAKHTVEIEIVETHNDGETPFYLLSIIYA